MLGGLEPLWEVECSGVRTSDSRQRLHSASAGGIFSWRTGVRPLG